MQQPMVSLTLPWPPSANSYIRHAGGIHYPTKQAKAFRESVAEIVSEQGVQTMTSRLHVFVRLFAPTKRKVDIDNRLKPLLDAMQHAGVYPDDEAIDRLVVERGEIVKGGRCKVVILAQG